MARKIVIKTQEVELFEIEIEKLGRTFLAISPRDLPVSASIEIMSLLEKLKESRAVSNTVEQIEVLTQQLKLYIPEWEKSLTERLTGQEINRIFQAITENPTPPAEEISAAGEA